MIVKENEKQLSFLFQEKDSYFEMGYLILKQANLAGMLPYKRVQQNGKEKLCFQISEVEKLSQILPKLAEDEVIDVLYAVVFMTQRIEENGFMKKECIWCRYEQIYMDRDSCSPMFAVLPITQEFRYADGSDWMRGFEECLYRIAEYLSIKKQQRIQQLIKLYKTGQMKVEEFLEEINQLGNGMSGLLVDKSEEEKCVKSNKLELVYAGREGTFQFCVGDEAFLIGRGMDSDGMLQISMKVSRRHCLITKINGNYFVQDLDSTNGTYVNDTQIPPYELMELEHNDILCVGDVELRVQVLCK
ncbi:MAG: FHA domain-containing protein [Lachnospiraceae bacterium]|nr:FHA domain-containing protein [Lachnospiraceae bacterium]MBQ3163352.1 FHA domain-containing protein [Lachnospiraceae bacterium]MBQ6993745.1 FHA domain-containing protein [Lachnospiraceae bacterium]